MDAQLYYVKNATVVGRICSDPRGGFTWVPFSTASQRSRKAWPTPEAAIKGRVSGGQLIEARNLQQAIVFAASSNGSSGRGKTEGPQSRIKTDPRNAGSTPAAATR